MKKTLRTKTAKVKKYAQVWQLHQALGRIVMKTDHVQDFQEIISDNRKVAPIQFIGLLF